MNIKEQLLSTIWWRAALIRAGRTAAVIILPYITSATVFGAVPYLAILSAAGLGVVASLLTSLAGLAEVTGSKQPWWYSTFSRVAKTFAQSTLSGIGTAVFFEDVAWSTILQLSLFSAIGSLVLAVIGNLPESDEPVAQATLTVGGGGTVTGLDGSPTPVLTEVPVIASVDSQSMDVTATPSGSGAAKKPAARRTSSKTTAAKGGK